MSADLQMSSADSVDFPYRALSRGAVTSVALFVPALLGLFPVATPLLALCVVGIVAGLFAVRSIRQYPDEFSGEGLAAFGILANLTLLIAGSGLHTYIYLTEVPDGYTRVHFYELQVEDGGADRPAPKAFEIDGQLVFLKGYIHPSSGSGLLRQFILVPDLGTCCFGGQPESSDMIEVTLTGGQTAKASLIKKKLAGEFTLNQAPLEVTDFDNSVFYRMRVQQIR